MKLFWPVVCLNSYVLVQLSICLDVGVNEKHAVCIWPSSVEVFFPGKSYAYQQQMKISFGERSEAAVHQCDPCEQSDASATLDAIPKQGDEKETSTETGNGALDLQNFFEGVINKGKIGLTREFYGIQKENPRGTFEASMSESNWNKNRYSNVLSIDETRVHLTSGHKNADSDYINANFVDGYQQKAAFIAAQGPLPHTVPDFWRMVWEQEVHIIVMVTRAKENGRVKCEEYWPVNHGMEVTSGELLVSNIGVEEKQGYRVSTMTVTHTQTQESREVFHFYFTSWPDFSVPESPEIFLQFLFDVRQKADAIKEKGVKNGVSKTSPIVVHCSAGIGRTGTFMAVDILSRQLAEKEALNIEATVLKIRSQRAFSVQTAEQYIFIHKALILYAQNEGLIPKSDFHEL